MWPVAAVLNVRATAQFQMRTRLGDADDSEEDRSSNTSRPARLPSRSKLTCDWRGAEVVTGFRLRVHFCPTCRMCSPSPPPDQDANRSKMHYWYNLRSRLDGYDVALETSIINVRCIHIAKAPHLTKLMVDYIVVTQISNPIKLPIQQRCIRYTFTNILFGVIVERHRFGIVINEQNQHEEDGRHIQGPSGGCLWEGEKCYGSRSARASRRGFRPRPTVPADLSD